MTSSVVIEQLPNGLTVIVEPVSGVESVAYQLMIPGGWVFESEDLQGGVMILAELTSRGVENLDARELSDAFDRLGARHSESVGSEHFSYGGMCLSQEFPEALRLTALEVLNPTLPEHEIAPIQSLLIQDINSLPDSPSRKVMHDLYAGYFPKPYNRSSLGTVAGIEKTTKSHLQALHQTMFSPQGAVFSVAGKVEIAQALSHVKKLFGNWSGQKNTQPTFGKVASSGYQHINVDSAQLQIALAYPSAPFGHPDYYAAKVASSILSGGMFGRVFVEVREKRGLVYSVSARHSANKDYGVVVAYAGTTPERAQETLDVLVAELRNLPGTIKNEELSRAKTTIKSSLVLGEESTASRAASNAQDFWIGKRVRPFEEIMANIEAVQAKDIDTLCQHFPADKFYLTTLGKSELTIK